MNLATILKNLGFSENKAKIYLSALSLGSGAASEIAKRAGIVRSTVYKLLEELVAEGLVEIGQGKVKQFVALHPSRLPQLFENKKQTAANFLPDFLNIFSTSDFKPRMRFFEGESGKKKVFEDILTLKDDIVYTYSPMKEVLNLFGKTYARHYMEKRVKNKIWRYALRPALDVKSAKQAWEFYGSDNGLMREIKFLPEDVNCDTLIQIYANKVGVVASKEDYAFIIESKELSGLMKQIFLSFWKKATTAEQAVEA